LFHALLKQPKLLQRGCGTLISRGGFLVVRCVVTILPDRCRPWAVTNEHEKDDSNALCHTKTSRANGAMIVVDHRDPVRGIPVMVFVRVH
jgi:hypothetical protein